MFIYAVTTPRNVRVSFGLPEQGKKNQISLLTGPNGSGKTDVLASIAHVFHDYGSNDYGATIQWAKETHIRDTNNWPMDERVPLITQTFSPFARFPAIRRTPIRDAASIFAPADADKYSCIGFNQSSRVELRKLAFSIVQNALLKLSERPRTARVAFEVLDELGFKNGFSLRYRANKYLMEFIRLSSEPTLLYEALNRLLSDGEVWIDNMYMGRVLKRLRVELKNFGADETNEYLLHAINMIEEYAADDVWLRGQKLTEYEYVAFSSKQGMSLDFPYLQAFSALTRLGLVELIGCKLTPITGERIDVTNASSGQQQMLCSIFGLAAAIEDNAIILIDEPELSLHPRWQMNFFKYLETALDVVEGCHVIIATHSALIAQAAANHGVKILALGNEEKVEQAKDSQESKAKSVESLLFTVFATPLPNSLHISKEIFKLVTKAESGTFFDRLDVIAQLERYIALYRRHGEGSTEMTSMLNKALELVTAHPTAA